MIGLALEGGGARGAFHMGAVKALAEEGYAFDGVTGTSIGAINGALIAQGDFEAGYALWESVAPSLLFNLEDEVFQKLLRRDIDKATLFQVATKLRMIIRNRGVDTGKIRGLLEEIINEEKIRRARTLFGLVTVSLSDFKAFELYKEDIPAGKLVDYLIASATFPGFKLTEIENRRYIDGGLFNNCPINLLSQKGYKHIVAVRTLAPGVFKTVRDPDVQVTTIMPSDDLGRILDFSNALARRNLQMGYYDTLRQIRGYLGCRYVIRKVSDQQILQLLQNVSEASIEKLAKLFGMEGAPSRRMLFEQILPHLAGKLGLLKDASWQEILVALMEILAEEKGVSRFDLYSFSGFAAILRKRGMETSAEPSSRLRIINSLQKRPQLLKAAQILIKHF